jgi:hypothetical protein
MHGLQWDYSFPWSPHGKKFEIERCNLKKINTVEVREQQDIRLKFQIGLQFWKSWVRIWRSVRLEEVLEGI